MHNVARDKYKLIFMQFWDQIICIIFSKNDNDYIKFIQENLSS
jgi:hypothetical protein